MPRGACVMEMSNKCDKCKFSYIFKSGTLIAQISKSIFDKQNCFQVKLVIILESRFMGTENSSGPVGYISVRHRLSKATWFCRNVRFMRKLSLEAVESWSILHSHVAQYHYGIVNSHLCLQNLNQNLLNNSHASQIERLLPTC